jgi:winged helix DNA-binding protein
VPAPTVVVMDDHELIRWRLASHRLAGAAFPSTAEGAADVVRWLGAVQSQDHEPALWSLAQRAGGVRLAELARAFDAGAFLRTHVLRPTWHFVPPEELRALLALTGPRVAAGCAARWRQLDLPAPVRARATEVMASAIGERGPLTRSELSTVLESAGISAAGQRLPHLLMHAELEAVLVSGGMRGRQHTWARVDDRVPAAGVFDREATLRAMTVRYVRSHGPVTERDFAWWSGLTLRDVREGLELAKPDVAHLETGGRRYWYGEEPPRSPGRRPHVHLVQSFDEYLVAYSESRSLADQAGYAKQMPRGWMLSTALLLDGSLAGRWRRNLAGGRAEVEVVPFASLSGAERNALAAEAERFAAFVDLPLRLTVVERGSDEAGGTPSEDGRQGEPVGASDPGREPHPVRPVQLGDEVGGVDRVEPDEEHHGQQDHGTGGDAPVQAPFR